MLDMLHNAYAYVRVYLYLMSKIQLCQSMRIYLKLKLGVGIAEWLASRTSKQEGPGSNPGGGKEV